jgi:flagellar assembly protein FliH
MYRDIAAPLLRPKLDEEHLLAAPGMTAIQLDELLTRVRNEAVAQTEQRLKSDYDGASDREAVSIRSAIAAFQIERKDYFARVEAEIVHLTLAIAAKILHREAQVDPMLIAALVRVAVEKLHDGSKVSVRIPPSEANRWRAFFANPLNGTVVEIVEDPNLGPKDCILDTDLGSANFSIEGQLKEVEQGFCDLLAQRPGQAK